MYIFVTLAIRLMGKRQIGDLLPNELVVTLLISEIAAIPLQDRNTPLIMGIAAIFTLVILEIIISVITMKSRSLRQLMSGKAVVIIKNGVLDEKAMKRVRITVLDLIELLRQNGVFDISEVAFAVLEVNGNLSVLKRSAFENVTRKDMKIKAAQSLLPLPVICDGKLIFSSLGELEITKQEIDVELEKRGLKTKDVFLLTADRDKTLRIVKKEKKL